MGYEDPSPKVIVKQGKSRPEGMESKGHWLGVFFFLNLGTNKPKK